MRFDAGPVLQFSSQYIQLLKMADGAFVVAIPFVAGVRPRSPLFDGVQSVWNFLKRKLGDNAPPLPDLETNEQKWTVTIPGKPPYWYTVRTGIPREDWLSVRAEKHYGDMLLWPLIFEATREEERKAGAVKFVNQNKMWAGRKVFVPDISGIRPTSARWRARAGGTGSGWGGAITVLTQARRPNLPTPNATSASSIWRRGDSLKVYCSDTSLGVCRRYIEVIVSSRISLRAMSQHLVAAGPEHPNNSVAAASAPGFGVRPAGSTWPYELSIACGLGSSREA